MYEGDLKNFRMHLFTVPGVNLRNLFYYFVVFVKSNDSRLKFPGLFRGEKGETENNDDIFRLDHMGGSTHYSDFSGAGAEVGAAVCAGDVDGAGSAPPPQAPSSGRETSRVTMPASAISLFQDFTGIKNSSLLNWYDVVIYVNLALGMKKGLTAAEERPMFDNKSNEQIP